VFIVLVIPLLYFQYTLKGSGEYVDYKAQRGRTPQEQIELLVDMASFPQRWVEWKFFLLTGLFSAAIATYILFRCWESRQGMTMLSALEILIVIAAVVFIVSKLHWGYLSFHGYPYRHAERARALGRQLEDTFAQCNSSAN
jgi:hypothetical protein